MLTNIITFHEEIFFGPIAIKRAIFIQFFTFSTSFATVRHLKRVIHTNEKVRNDFYQKTEGGCLYKIFKYNLKNKKINRMYNLRLLQLGDNT